MNYQYTLMELLCFKVIDDVPFGQNGNINRMIIDWEESYQYSIELPPFTKVDINRMIVKWAENLIMQENISDSLLILASLDLDSTISEIDFKNYLNRYLIENKISLPSLKFAHIVWLKFFLRHLLTLKDRNAIENTLSVFDVNFKMHPTSLFFSKLWSKLLKLNEYLFEFCCQTNVQRVDSMDDTELLRFIQNKLLPVLKITQQFTDNFILIE
ncbi:hypothetical protein [Thorsellia anophelis]|uniref:Uncharacterized protein n=1 Tax=Thorsellia anophelis DSM 18579 TaxID=1123402 RepID=A0A1I0BSR5_9GAMM|nr:hypothetical protein [Thorsellia anophelis]SET09792.1 hypothetical protein SAMN02583745_01383 [Thorsellia anophelis DSM 18579]